MFWDQVFASRPSDQIIVPAGISVAPTEGHGQKGHYLRKEEQNEEKRGKADGGVWRRMSSLLVV